jgi:hypothetical protein
MKDIIIINNSLAKLCTEQMKKQEDHDDPEITHLNIKKIHNKEQVML